jgi:hypothetical protein
MFKEIWTLVRRIAVILGLFLVFFVLAELARTYMLFYRIHPIAGYVFAGLVVVGGVASIYYLTAGLRVHPPVLVPPALPDPPGHKDMRRYCEYLVRYLDRLSENAGLPEDRRQAARDKAADIEDVLRAHPLNDDLVRTIQQTENDVIGPLLGELDAKASHEVRLCVRDVMLGVILSPYASIDMLIVIYRNAAMVLKIVQVYRSRPGVREQLLILRDIFLVVATVNFLNIGRKLIESLFAQIPIIGRVVDDIGQGMGAGLLTSVAGHAAISRCSAFRGWSREEEVRSLGAHMGGFLVDVRDLFTKDLLNELKGRIRSEVPPGTADQPGFWETLNRGITTAVDTTAKMLDSLVLKPAVAGAQGIASAGTFVTRGVVHATSSAARHSVRHTRRATHGARRILRLVGQRIKYTFFMSGPR